MGEYILGIIGAAAVIGIMETVVPQNTKTKQYMRLITSLCLLCIVIKPLGAVMESLPNLLSDATENLVEKENAAKEEYQRILEGEITETVRDTLRDAIKSELQTRFGVKNCEVGLVLVRVDGELRVQRAVVTLMGTDIFKDPYAIEDYIATLLGCECVVVIG